MGGRAPSRLEGLLLRLYALLVRRSGRRLGGEYVEGLTETLRLRLLDSRRLRAPRRAAFVVREIVALARVAAGGSPAGARLTVVPSPEQGGGAGPLQIARELRLAARQLLRAPTFTLLTTGILALGIGANAAIFSVVNAVLVRPLPYAEPGRLVQIRLENPVNRFNPSPADFLALREAALGFDAVVGTTERGSTFYPQTFTISLTALPEPEVVDGSWVSAGFFEALGVPPLLGRGVAAGEDTADAEPVVVLSHAFWQEHHGGAREILGRQLQINGVEHTVVGVMPRSFRDPTNADARVWPAFRMREPGRRGPFFVTVLARLADGWTPERAGEALAALQERVRERWGDSFSGADTRYVLVPLHEQVVGAAADILWVLFGSVACVLLIALANVANLMLDRTARRGREFALRSALGASRGRLLGQLLAEGVVLAALAGAAGLLVGVGFLRLLLASSPVPLPRQGEIALDGTVVGFAILLAAAIAITLALVPARRGLGEARARALRQGGRAGTEGREGVRLRSLLVFAEVALAVPLLIAAMLLATTLLTLHAADPGFAPERILTLRLALPVERYTSADEVLAELAGLQSSGAAVPGVEALGLASSLPPTRLAGRNNFVVRGEVAEPDAAQRVAHYVSASPGFFRALALPVIAGRTLTDADGPDEAPVAVVDRAFADTYLGGVSAVGREMQFGGCDQCPWARVVGIVDSVRYDGVERQPEPTIYVPLAQEFQPVLFLLARTQGDPAALAPALRAAVIESIPGGAATELRPAAELLSESIAAPRHRASLIGLFAALATLLAAVGVYGVVATFVVRHTGEIGVRMAVGASRRDVVRFVVSRAAGPVVSGLVVGIALSLLTGRLLQGLVHGVRPTSPWVTAAAAGLLALIAAAGTLGPARRASRIDPVHSLRSE